MATVTQYLIHKGFPTAILRNGIVWWTCSMYDKNYTHACCLHVLKSFVFMCIYMHTTSLYIRSTAVHGNIHTHTDQLHDYCVRIYELDLGTLKKEANYQVLMIKIEIYHIPSTNSAQNKKLDLHPILFNILFLSIYSIYMRRSLLKIRDYFSTIW